VKEYCEQVGRASARAILCAGDQPEGMSPTSNADILRPRRDRYVFEFVADGRHWIFAASTSSDDLRR